MFKKLKNGLTSVFKKTLKEDNMESVMEDLKITLIKNDVGFDVAQKITDNVQESLEGEKVGLFSKKNALEKALRDAVEDILREEESYDLVEKIKSDGTPKPYIIMVLGVNGTGKTTTIAKLVNLFKKKDLSVVLAASDTFRAGAIEQLHKHMKNLDTRLIKREYKADPSSVAYDTIEHDKAKDIDVVIIDTSGRQVNNKNLIEELKKIKRINQPHLTLFIGDSLAGNDVTYQCEEFNKAVGIDASILTKVDADAKGGAAISTTFITNKPILYLGVGQGYDDLVPFKQDWLIENMFGDS